MNGIIRSVGRFSGLCKHTRVCVIVTEEVFQGDKVSGPNESVNDDDCQ